MASLMVFKGIANVKGKGGWQVDCNDLATMIVAMSSSRYEMQFRTPSFLLFNNTLGGTLEAQDKGEWIKFDGGLKENYVIGRNGTVVGQTKAGNSMHAARTNQIQVMVVFDNH